MTYRFAFERLEVYQKAKALVRLVYGLTAAFPQKERYGLGAQLSRAVVSVASNIAEGSSRTSGKDQAHFSQMAYGSLMEVLCQLDVACELDYLSNYQIVRARESIEEIARMPTALRKTQGRKGEKP